MFFSSSSHSFFGMYLAVITLYPQQKYVESIYKISVNFFNGGMKIFKQYFVKFLMDD